MTHEIPSPSGEVELSRSTLKRLRAMIVSLAFTASEGAADAFTHGGAPSNSGLSTAIKNLTAAAALFAIAGVGATSTTGCVPAITVHGRTPASSVLPVQGMGSDKSLTSVSSLDGPPASTVLIEGVEYDVEKTVSLDLKGDVVPPSIKRFKNLTVLKINHVTKIPGDLLYELNNLVELHAELAISIPDSLTTLKRLSANSATSIPDSLVNLTWLSADTATSIPDTLVKLVWLSAFSAFSIPETLVDLEFLDAARVDSIPDTLIKLKFFHGDTLNSVPNTLRLLEFLHVSKNTTLPSTLKSLCVLHLGSMVFFSTDMQNDCSATLKKNCFQENILKIYKELRGFSGHSSYFKGVSGKGLPPAFRNFVRWDILEGILK